MDTIEEAAANWYRLQQGDLIGIEVELLAHDLCSIDRQRVLTKQSSSDERFGQSGAFNDLREGDVLAVYR